MIPSEYCYRVLAIDPGTDTLGSAVLDVDVRVGDVEVPYAGTWHAARRFDPDSDAAYTYGSRLARIREHQDSLVRLLEEHKPHAVACETPFIGRFAQSGMALSELFGALQLTVLEWSPNCGFLGVDNRSAKTAVGIKTKKVQKEDVRNCVYNLIDLQCINGIDLKHLDEHSIDAIAVGYYAAGLLREEWRTLDTHRRTSNDYSLEPRG